MIPPSYLPVIFAVRLHFRQLPQPIRRAVEIDVPHDLLNLLIVDSQRPSIQYINMINEILALYPLIIPVLVYARVREAALSRES